MADYKEMYLKIFRASSQAIDILIEAQQECEELYMTELEPTRGILSLPSKNNDGKEEF